jgi:hypothetical protein
LPAIDQARSDDKVAPIKVEIRPGGDGTADVWGLYPFGTGHEWDLARAGFDSPAEAAEHINSVYESIA